MAHLAMDEQTSTLAGKAVNLQAGRRELIKGLGLGAAAAALATVADTGVANAQAASGTMPNFVINDTNILRFTLNFEYLGAELYLRATTGSGVPTDMITGSQGQAAGGVKGGAQVTFTDPNVQAYFKQLAADELAHVKLFRSALGNNVIARPTIDFIDGFTALAYNAGLIGDNTTFDPFANQTNLLLASYVLEDVCVTALHGAATLLTSKSILDTAGGVLATEAYQAGMIRTQLFLMGYANQTQSISYLRSRLDGSAGTPAQGNDHGVGTLSAATIANVDSNSIAGERTFAQVLRVAYGNTSGTPGGLFPQGINIS